MRILLAFTAMLAAAGCVAPRAIEQASAPVSVKIIALNDFHGALQPPRLSVPATAPDGSAVKVPAGGAAYLASAIQSLRAQNPNHIVVSAGDLISASPLVSAQFLDEPTILAMNMIGLDFNAVGNHEFDRGRQELLRMQNGGCEKHTSREPCRVDRPFPGARFQFLAANVATRDGGTLFPATALRRFGSGKRQVSVGIIGLTLRETPTLVTPGGVAGLDFRDEAETINALVPRLKEEGADAIVVVIHQGVSTKVPYSDKSCEGIDGDLLPILARLDPVVDVVVSGHTHNAYICDYGRIDPARPFLVTSAGKSGVMLTDIALSIDPLRGVVAKTAEPVIVQGEAFTGSAGEVPVSAAFPKFDRDPEIAALVDRYAAAAAPIINRVVGRLSGSALETETDSGESVLGDLIADAHLAATRESGAVIAFTNGTGVRADLIAGADGAVTYGQLFAAQPFGNNLTVKSFTGAQLKALLEQQFASGTNTAESPIILLPSQGFYFVYDLKRPAGDRIVEMRLEGTPINPAARYRVAMNSFLASGGDNFTVFREGTETTGGPQDIDALERYIAQAGTLTLPTANRIVRVAP